MKKIALVILTTITLPTYATTMCAANDTVAVVLDPNMEIKNRTFDNIAGIWSASSSSWTLHGNATCLNNGSGIVSAHLYDTDNDGKYHVVTGTERYGRHCWCRIVHPVLSLWVLSLSASSVSSCVGGCANYCSNRLGYELLTRLVSSIVN